MKSLTSIISKVQDMKLKKLKLHIKELNKDMRKIQRDYKWISERETKDDRSRLKPDDLIRELGVKLGKHLSAEKKNHCHNSCSFKNLWSVGDSKRVVKAVWEVYFFTVENWFVMFNLDSYSSYSSYSIQVTIFFYLLY